MMEETQKEDLSFLRPVVSLEHFKERFESCHIVPEQDPGENWLRTTLEASLRPMMSLELFRERFESFQATPGQDPGENWVRTTLQPSSDSKSSAGLLTPNPAKNQIPYSQFKELLEAALHTTKHIKSGTRSRAKVTFKGRTQARKIPGGAVKKNLGQGGEQSELTRLDIVEMLKASAADSSSFSLAKDIRHMVGEQVFQMCIIQFVLYLLDLNRKGSVTMPEMLKLLESVGNENA